MLTPSFQTKPFSKSEKKSFFVLNTRSIKFLCFLLTFLGVFFLFAFHAFAQQSSGLPSLSLSIGGGAGNGDVSNAIKIVVLLTILSLAPSILISVTCFTRLIVVLSFLRHAMGTQTMPPTQIMVSLALFLTFYIMNPVWQNINQNALTPYMNEEIPIEEALEKAGEPLRNFMLKQTREKDIQLVMSVSGQSKPNTIKDVPFTVVVASFILSELKTSFQMGFLIYIPFLIIDLVVASVLMGLGMMMLPPFLVSLPIKVMIFVLADGWTLVVHSLVKSFGSIT